MRQILNHFGDSKFLLARHNLAYVHVGDADIEVISYFGKEGFSGCVLVEVVELPPQAVVVSVEILSIQ